MSEWQPIETAPAHGRVIAYFNDGDILTVTIESWKRDDGDDCWVTHWMPLPSPPTSGAEQ